MGALPGQTILKTQADKVFYQHLHPPSNTQWNKRAAVTRTEPLTGIAYNFYCLAYLSRVDSKCLSHFSRWKRSHHQTHLHSHRRGNDRLRRSFWGLVSLCWHTFLSISPEWLLSIRIDGFLFNTDTQTTACCPVDYKRSPGRRGLLPEQNMSR